MKDPADSDRFTDEEYAELGQLLFLREPVPDHLKSLWEYAAGDPASLARVEDHRVWYAQIAEALRASAEPLLMPNAREKASALWLELKQSAKGWQVLVRNVWGIGPALSMATLSSVRGKTASDESETAHLIEFQGFTVKVVAGREIVEITIASSKFPLDQVMILALDEQGQTLDRKKTDKRGTATIRIQAKTAFEIKIGFPEFNDAESP